MIKNKLVDFIIHFMGEVDKEISNMKLVVNARGRIVATEFLSKVRARKDVCACARACACTLSYAPHASVCPAPLFVQLLKLACYMEGTLQNYCNHRSNRHMPEIPCI